jgi:hypothetical protein
MAKRGVWANIHAKRKRIKAGSGERMRKKGAEGAPTEEQIKNSQKEMGGKRKLMQKGGSGKFPPKIKKMLKKSKAPKKGGVLDEVTVTAKAPSKTEKASAKEFSKGLSAMELGFPNTTVKQYYELESVGNKAVDKGIDARGDISGAFDSVNKLKKDTKKRAKRGQAFRYKHGGKKMSYMKRGGKKKQSKTMYEKGGFLSEPSVFDLDRD